MTHLKSLNFTALSSGGGDPILGRRAKLIAHLEDQIALAKDPNYAPTDQRRVKGEERLKEIDRCSSNRPPMVAFRRHGRDGFHRALRLQAH